eukprot:CAMPEP_0201564410 /NCGR_PEP_ID=MMETSP0190_2-20130828/2695_1 /ASSEMBLY_ACC=CAM_ASM_000263 /TAXON_ID=37353 /ORGANISM="Rosalina sp." /LENGTH=904 /DNA_ID=CAMNT_0047980563 /DNA_START=16 /DNA_END=2730 /DNA_ORIENTATION=+
MSPLHLLLPLVLAFILHNEAKVHKCSHDGIHPHIDIKEEFINYNNHPYDNSMKFHPTTINEQSTISSKSKSRRRELDHLSSTQPQPIRIKPYYDPNMISEQNGLLPSQIEYIKSLISTVIRHYESFVSVIPVSDPLTFHRTCTYGLNTEFGVNCLEYLEPNQCGMADIPDQHMAQDYLYFDPSNTTTAIKLPSGAGIPDTDLVIYVTYAQTDSCGPSTLAWALPCGQDQHGRPISGNVNICPYMFESDHFWKQDTIILLHEINHIMIMGPPLWDDFRDPADGSLIPKDEVVSAEQPDGYFYIISPSVKQFAQTHFGCDQLIGWPLEDTGSEGSAGAHWDERFTMSALMGSTIWGGLHFFSGLTFALMNDSGWYDIDYNYVEPYYWAKNAGCEYFNLECIDTDTEQSNWPQYFCVSPNDNGCAYNYDAPAYCEYYFMHEELPPGSRYFSDSTHGGPAAADYCPFRDPNTPISDFEGACWNVKGNDYVRTRFDAEIHGVNARCVDIESNDGVFQGYCFEHTCFGYDENNKQWDGVMIHIDNEEVINCTRFEQPDGTFMTRKYSLTQDVYITCPNIDSICGETTNPLSCFFGNWNDNLEKCVCNAGYIGDQCDIEDTEIHEEIVLDENKIITTSTPSTPISDVLCVKDFSLDIINGEYVHDGIWNFYPIWKNEENGLYVHWNIFAHWWIIGNQVDTFFHHALCNVSEWTQDITDCNQYWRVYQPDIGETVKEESASIYYGPCDSKSQTTTQQPTIDRTATTTGIPTESIVTVRVDAPEKDNDNEDTSLSTSGIPLPLPLSSEYNITSDHTAIYPSQSPTYPTTIGGKLDLAMDEYAILFIALGLIIVIFLLVCLLICGCKIMQNVTSYHDEDEARQTLGGGQRTRKGHVGLKSGNDEESTEYQYVQT